jgi:glutamate/tyrosine decarboxylase-like PLP-dependent enzyme
METPGWRPALQTAANEALAYLEALAEAAVGPTISAQAMRARLDRELPDEPQDPAAVVRELAAAARPGLMGTMSGRFFGYVIGGSQPAALAADWLTSAWDQNAGLWMASPAEAAVEELAGRWLTDLLGLPDEASVGFVTGGQTANLTCLGAARHGVLADAGCDVERDGLVGAPRIRVLAGAGRHDTVDLALRLLGLGTAAVTEVAADADGRMRPDALAAALDAGQGPVIVCAQAGNVNSGAIDPLGQICELGHRHGAWVHVDGAFGLWAGASPTRCELVAGVDAADSWATDAHKWLNVPYDSGLAFTAHPAAHRAAMSVHADYLAHATAGERDPSDWTPELSRRGRGFAVYAALASLGRTGVAALVDRCCDLAARLAEQLAAADGVTVLNEVELNQVLVAFVPPGGGDADAHTREVTRRVQQEGTCFATGTVWHGQAALRLSVSNWATDAEDVDRSVAAIVACHQRSR